MNDIDTDYENKFKYSLGQHGIDSITLFSGIMVERYYHMNGCKFYRIQPKVKDDNVFVDSEWISETTIEANNLEEKITMFKIKMKSEVESEVTKFRGTVVARAEHLHGVNRYFIQPVADKDGKVPSGMWIDENELVVLNAGIEDEKGDKTKPGGFMSAIK